MLPANEAFVNQMILHRSNVAKIADVIRREFPVRFAHVSPALLRAYLIDFHDRVKFMSLDELRAYGYDRNETVASVLEWHHGINAAHLPSGAREDFLAFIRDFNRIEEDLKRTFFSVQNISESVERDMRLIERVADVVDTRMSPLRAHELGFQGRPPSGVAEWLLVAGEPEASSIARAVEGRYTVIVSPTAQDREWASQYSEFRALAR